MLLSHTPDIFYIAFDMQGIDVNVSISDITTPVNKVQAPPVFLPVRRSCRAYSVL